MKGIEEEEKADLKPATTGIKAKFRKRFASTVTTLTSVETSSLSAPTARIRLPKARWTSRSLC